MIKKISLCMASIVFVIMVVMNFQRFEPTENAYEINLEILKSAQAQGETGECQQCWGANSTCTVFYWCNLCGPNGESIMQLIEFPGYDNFCI